MVAYARKRSKSAIFEWQEKGRRWYLYANEFPLGWKKNVKVVYLPAPTKKGSMSSTTKPKSTKKGNDSSKTYSDLVPYKRGLPPIDNIVLERSPLPSTRTRSNKRSIVGKPRPSVPKPSMDAPPSSRTHGSKKKTSPPEPSATAERRSFLYLSNLLWRSGPLEVTNTILPQFTSRTITFGIRASDPSTPP
ncbi:hypothetical protein SO802_009933 [Lithocarpus litseifolius]|uniref:Uncharacterized protein n=1 Tax=Lithocarpus litseifolius TaxID=425828 RepID=A0AAW2DH62_9ROSI